MDGMQTPISTERMKNMNNDFIEAYTTDDLWISLRIAWDSNKTYWICPRPCEDADEIQCFGIECKFLGESSTFNKTLIFVDMYGVKHEIDPIIEKSRENIKIYSWVGGEFPQGFPYEEKWFEIATIPFDRNFFKLGHCYMVKETRTEDPKPMMLMDMNFDQMHFVCVADPERFKDPGIKHVYVKAERYKRMKKPYWFQALMEGDVWSNDKYKEMAEDNTEQETGSGEIS